MSWTWSAWSFAEFGYCTFINFGKAYAGARDRFVYLVSHDHPDAYVPADHFVLTRVPTAQVVDRNAYEFFSGLDDDRQPLWSGEIANRAPVFVSKGRALRSSISFNPEIGRYLWWQHLLDEGFDTRFVGGFGVYEAPEPWGPWRTVYLTRKWDGGPGETGHFPTKWTSGSSVYLVLSGDDTFAVREGTLILRDSSKGTLNLTGPNHDTILSD